MKIDKYKVGNFICDLRTAKGLTQKDLALLLGVTNKAVSKWEVGDNQPEVSMLYKLAGVLDVSVDEIMKGSVIPKERELNFIKSQLEEKKQAVIRYNKRYLLLVVLIPIVMFMTLLGIVFLYVKALKIYLNSDYIRLIFLVCGAISLSMFGLINVGMIYVKYIIKQPLKFQLPFVVFFPITFIILFIFGILGFPILYTSIIFETYKG